MKASKFNIQCDKKRLVYGMVSLIQFKLTPNHLLSIFIYLFHKGISVLYTEIKDGTRVFNIFHDLTTIILFVLCSVSVFALCIVQFWVFTAVKITN